MVCKSGLWAGSCSSQRQWAAMEPWEVHRQSCDAHCHTRLVAHGTLRGCQQPVLEVKSPLPGCIHGYRHSVQGCAVLIWLFASGQTRYWRILWKHLFCRPCPL